MEENRKGTIMSQDFISDEEMEQLSGAEQLPSVSIPGADFISDEEMGQLDLESQVMLSVEDEQAIFEQQQADKANFISDEEMSRMEIKSKYKPETSMVEAGLRGLVDSATFGAGKYIEAGVDSFFTGQSFDDALIEAELENEKAEKEYGTAYDAGQIAGFFVPGAMVAKGAKLAGKGIKSVGKGTAKGVTKVIDKYEDFKDNSIIYKKIKNVADKTGKFTDAQIDKITRNSDMQKAYQYLSNMEKGRGEIVEGAFAIGMEAAMDEVLPTGGGFLGYMLASRAIKTKVLDSFKRTGIKNAQKNKIFNTKAEERDFVNRILSAKSAPQLVEVIGDLDTKQQGTFFSAFKTGKGK